MKKVTTLYVTLAVVCLGFVGLSFAQFGRRHTVTQSNGELKTLPSSSRPTSQSQVSITVQGNQRVIQSNGIPNHNTGAFPNRGNPNRISAQRYQYRVPATPQAASKTSASQGIFGVAINGVPFDPGAAEFYNGQMGSKWQYEPLSGAIALGIDASHAHVQPNGAYHYHGLPTGLLDEVKLDPSQHSPLVGWAADGFPIYAMYGYSNPKDPNSEIVKLSSSYQIRRGTRPGGREPSGRYDGTFVADYEFAEGAGELDQCNGRYTVTPDFPEGTYAYFLSENWPVIPRNFRGTPSTDFAKHGPGTGGPGFGGSNRGGGRGFGPPPRGSGPPPRRGRE
ncbi:MAG: YHYH protein [Planctomycetota bacterium]